MPAWLILGGIGLGVNIIGTLFGIGAAKRRERAAKKAIGLSWENAKQQLQLGESRTLGELTARAGRGGAEVASTEAMGGYTTPTPKEGGNTGLLAPSVRELFFPGRYTDPTVTGSGSVALQQRYTADLYRQELDYTRERHRASFTEASYSGSEAADSGLLNIIGDILSTGADLYKKWYEWDLLDPKTDEPSFEYGTPDPGY